MNGLSVGDGAGSVIDRHYGGYGRGPHCLFVGDGAGSVIDRHREAFARAKAVPAVGDGAGSVIDRHSQDSYDTGRGSMSVMAPVL